MSKYKLIFKSLSASLNSFFFIGMSRIYFNMLLKKKIEGKLFQLI